MPRGVKRRKHRNGRRGPRRGGGLGFMEAAVTQLNVVRSRLASERDALSTRIAAVDSAIASLGGAAVRGGGGRTASAGRPTGARGRGRPSPGGSLKDHIVKVMQGRGTMRVKDVTAGVLDSGFPTRNKTLGKSVGIALTQIPGMKKLGRGRFRLA